MGPQCTPRRSVAARHPMLLRSMARTRASPVPTHTNESHHFQETSFSSVANTSSGNRALDRIQRHPSPGPETSDPLFFATHSQGHPHIQGPQNHVHRDSSSSSVASTPPLIVDSTVSDPSLNGVNPLDELPSKPTIPVELMTQVDQKILGYLETFHTRSQRLFNEQKATSEFTKEQISVVAQQCIDLQAIIELRKKSPSLRVNATSDNEPFAPAFSLWIKATNEWSEAGMLLRAMDLATSVAVFADIQGSMDERLGSGSVGYGGSS
ncbi:hypothetical protein C8J55DRAFT_566597 [Lentinula edodes]|uniref:Uncharacterized protein n=1 Tax=Lentinula lateritia TaxID=40482 RepID=A0A9W9DDM9_9AGAR|nr:hypothetical protein C8J55DRAFT_566597 [Lentinula edodes]